MYIHLLFRWFQNRYSMLINNINHVIPEDWVIQIIVKQNKMGIEGPPIQPSTHKCFLLLLLRAAFPTSYCSSLYSALSGLEAKLWNCVCGLWLDFNWLEQMTSNSLSNSIANLFNFFQRADTREFRGWFVKEEFWFPHYQVWFSPYQCFIVRLIHCAFAGRRVE